MSTLRGKALELLKAKLPKNKAVVVDYQIDDYFRKISKLPDRPLTDLPYVGWMIEDGEPSTKQMRTSQRGIDLIKSHEGLRTKAYMCPANVLTIGYGHTRSVFPGQVIDVKEAEELLKEDLIRFENAVNKYVEVYLNQNQFDALVSFTFNVGISAFRNSTMLRPQNYPC